MSVHVQKFSVDFEYPVYFTYDVFSPDSVVLLHALSRREPDRRHRCLVVLDRGVSRAWPDLAFDVHQYARAHPNELSLLAEPIVVGGGEAAKNDPSAPARLHMVLNEFGVDRESFVVVVGGTAVQDMVGFAASTAHRGVRVLRVATTVLAQAGGALGPKTGVNAFGKKDFLGTFAPPLAVLCDGRLLSTLGKRDKIAGLSEAIAVALARDGGFLRWLIEHRDALAACDPSALDETIRRSAELHLDAIAESNDPFDLGGGALDLGRWAAHKLESMTASRLRHGEALAIGLALDTVYSAEVGLFPANLVDPVLQLIEGLGLCPWDDALHLESSNGHRLLLEGLSDHAAQQGGEPGVTLLAGVGRTVRVREVREEAVLLAIDRLLHLHARA